MSRDDDDSLAQNPVPEPRFQSSGRHELQLAADQVRELSLQTDEFKETNWSAELDKQINVAVVVGLIPDE